MRKLGSEEKVYGVGSFGVGVYTSRNKTGKTKEYNAWVAMLQMGKISTYKGIFTTIEEAADCYRKEKEKQLIDLAIKYKDTITSNTYNALLNYEVDLNN